MAMSGDQRLEKVQRLLTAHRKTKEALENETVSWELHPGSDIARKWSVITAAYSGLEQTLKYLIADEKDKTIPELIRRENGKRSPFETHNVAWLFSQLENSTQMVVREFYGRYQSLHMYITVETVDEFLGMVSGSEGRGYARWRYSLIEDRDMEIPKNSPEGLVATWGVCVEIARERAWGKPKIQMPDAELATTLGMEFQNVMLDVSVERQSAGEPFQDLEREGRDWAWRKKGHPLNAFADVLWHLSRYEEHGQTDISEWLSEALTRWAKAVLTNPVIAGRTMIRIFVERAQGDMRNGQSVRWNRAANRFEAVPWSLEARHQGALPQGAIEFGDPTGMRLRALWATAKRSRCRVLENRAFDAPPNEEPWFCTLELQSRDGADKRPILSIWQERFNTARKFYLVESARREHMDEHLRTWIEMVALKTVPQAAWLPD